LRLMEAWAAKIGDRDTDFGARAARVYQSFYERFWCEERGYLYDVVDPEGGAPGSADAKCRPNQIFAVSLPHPVLARDRWEAVVRTVRERLLTPVGLRSLSPDDPDFQARYYGDLRARDAAYHQGTVWAWLIGAFVDAWLRVFPEGDAEVEAVINGCLDHLHDA